MTNKEILEIKFWSDDLDTKVSIREYFKALLAQLWQEGECFSAKRPFGNSEWKYELYTVLVKHGIIEGEIDEDGYLDTIDEYEADTLILNLIAEI